MDQPTLLLVALWLLAAAGCCVSATGFVLFSRRRRDGGFVADSDAGSPSSEDTDEPAAHTPAGP